MALGFALLPPLDRQHIGAYRRLCPLLLAVLLFILMAHPPIFAENEILLKDGAIEVVYAPGDTSLARQTLAGAQRACMDINRALGIPCAGPFRVALMRDRDAFIQITGAEVQSWALAVAIPDRNMILVDATKATPVSPNDVRVVMVHEAVHLALARAEADRRDGLPRWFHEGVATWLSGRQHFPIDRQPFLLAAAQGKLIPLRDLAAEFPQEQRRADLAYLESEAFIVHLASTYSPEAVRWILDRYRQGETFEVAFQGALGIPRATAEAGWAESLRKRFPWLTMLWQVTSLFGALAVATILAYFVVRLRARRQHREWEEEESAWTVVAPYEDDAGEDESDPDAFT